MFVCVVDGWVGGWVGVYRTNTHTHSHTHTHTHTHIQVAWGAAEAALLDCGIGEELCGDDAALLQAFKGIRSPLPKLARPLSTAQLAQWLKSLGFDEQSLATYTSAFVNRAIDSTKVLQ